MNVEDLVKRAYSKNNTYEDWLQLEKDMLKFLSEDYPIKEKRRLYPLGALEIVYMMLDGIEREKGIERPINGTVVNIRN